VSRDVVLLFADVSKEYLPFRRFFLDLLSLENEETAFLRNERKREPSETAAHSIRPVAPTYRYLFVLRPHGTLGIRRTRMSEF